MSLALSRLLAIVGPTACGKTDVACEISKSIPVEMISCDSMQVYKSMPIVTQAPPKKVTRTLKTHLVSFLNPTNEYNAALFRKDALSLIPKILKRKQVPLLVGGTGLYLRALLEGLFEADENVLSSDETFRRKLIAEQEKHGGDTLHKKLEAVDPVSAKKIHPNDFRRLVRALEVFHLTQKPMSLQKDNREGIRDAFDCRVFLLNRDRQDLYERINHRVDKMLKEGLVEEVRKLRRKKLSRTAGMALGIQEIGAYLEGRLSLDEAKEVLKKKTRNYAKRQLSWFRHEKGVETIHIAPGESAARTAERILKLL